MVRYKQRLRQVTGGALVVLGAVSFYAAWILTRRTVFDYVHLGGWGVSTGVVLVGALLTVTFGGVVALSRGYRRFVVQEDDLLGEAKRHLTTPPVSRLWKPLVSLGVFLWLFLFFSPESTASLSVFEPLAIVAWVLVPVSVYLDSESFDTEDSGGGVRTHAYAIASLFPFFAALAGVAYLVRSTVLPR